MNEPSGRDEAEAQAERYRALLEINNAVVGKLTRDTLFAAVAPALRRILPFERIAIFLHDPARDVLRLFVLESTVPSPYFAVGLEMPAGASHMGHVFKARLPLLRRDLEVEREYPAEDLALADGIHSFISVPLIAGGRAIGTLAIASTTPNRYSEADSGFVMEVAGQVALAVANMIAYEEITALKARLERENVYLQEEIRQSHNFVELVGSSPVLLALLERVEQAAPTEATVLILGETGTGKELIARAVHGASPRRERPLVKVDCTSLSAGLVESELFGHAKGAFTGAIDRRIGRFELADRGTIFLDEVGELPLEAQAKLLRVLQEQQFEPVGSNRTVKVDVRVIAATNRDLEGAVRDGRFRADLFYRLNVVPLHVPPLRERRQDIPQLAAFFLARYAKTFGRPATALSPASLERLALYDWPGNVRELQNVMERAVVLSAGPLLELPPDLFRASPPAAGAVAAPPPPTGPLVSPAIPPPPEPATLEEVERAHIVRILEKANWVVQGPRGAAAILGLHPNTLRSRMDRLGIRRRSEPS
ncbi:MAG TPA: sigma 54-interacting transcriptional regulator [Methylomirabilota bacterium]|nr:sigma 54-interacting transcriptional regulator [Methylomirabilota bacterium]